MSEDLVNRMRLVIAICVAAVLGVGVVVLGFSPQQEAQASASGSQTSPGGTQSVTFNYTGSEQTWTVPAGVTTASVTAYGAQGGGSLGGNTSLGAVVTGSITVSPGQTLYVEVGGVGDAPNARTDPCSGGTQSNQCTAAYGGFNGGGSSEGGQTADGALSGGGGGGASDVQTVSGPVPVLLTQGPVSSQALASRLIVAGGGGGAGGWGTKNGSHVANANPGFGGSAAGGVADGGKGYANYSAYDDLAGGGGSTGDSGGAGGTASAVPEAGQSGWFGGQAGQSGSGGKGGGGNGGHDNVPVDGYAGGGGGGGGGGYVGGGGGGAGGVYDGNWASPPNSNVYAVGAGGGGGAGSSLVPAGGTVATASSSAPGSPNGLVTITYTVGPGTSTGSTTGPTTGTTTTPPPPPKDEGTPAVGSVAGSKKGATVKISCKGASGAKCHLAGQISVQATVTSGRITAFAARSHKRTILIGSKHFVVAAGKRATQSITLNAVGKKLVGKHPGLPARVTLSARTKSGKWRTIATRTIRL